MGRLETSRHFVALCCKKKALVLDVRNTSARTLDIPEPVNEKTDNKKTPPEGSDVICVKISNDERYIAVASEPKVVTVWCTETWKLQHTQHLVKRPVALDITPCSSTLLVADKTGDVYDFPLLGGNQMEHQPSSQNNGGPQEEEDVETGPKPLLGHLSMLLDVAITADSRYILTCDRDEKIRVSHYPNAYNIHTYCLGHQEFVSQISLLPENSRQLVSCSGDGTLRLWDYEAGSCLSVLDTREHTASHLHHYTQQTPKEEVKDDRRVLPDYPPVCCIALRPGTEEEHLVAAILDKIPAVYLYKVKDKRLEFVSTTSLENVPIALAWLQSGELVVQGQGGDQPLRVFAWDGTQLTKVVDHAVITLGQEHKDILAECGEGAVSIDVLYKQRYDNVADYMKKKEERLVGGKALEGEGVAPVKKGRWV